MAIRLFRVKVRKHRSGQAPVAVERALYTEAETAAEAAGKVIRSHLTRASEYVVSTTAIADGAGRREGVWLCEGCP
jgi:hypothetical protein